MEIEELDLRSRYIVARNRRLRVVMVAAPSVIATLIWIWLNGVNYEYLTFLGVAFGREVLLSLVVGLFSLSALTLIVVYLQTGFGSSEDVRLELIRSQLAKEAQSISDNAKSDEVASDVRKELQLLRDELERTKAAIESIDETSRGEIVAKLRASLVSDTGKQVLSEIRTEVANAHSIAMHERESATRLDDSKVRLIRELDALGRRGNLNLGLGAVTTIVGIAFLGFSVFAEASTTKDPWSLVSHFAPRLTLVLLIELFAFFFLSLYRSSLTEIKYFQNEITNIEARQLAIRTARDIGEPSLLTAVVTKLADTDRNHIISKDQTTVELERARIEHDSRSDLLKSLTELFQKKA